MASKSKKLCVVIPMYNEEKGAEICVNTIIKELRSLNTKPPLIVVNDGSKDKTPDILHKMQKRYNTKELIVLTHKTNKGYGGAHRTAIKYALEKGYEFAIFMDSDLTDNPKYLKTFEEKVSKNVDCVKASRLIKGSHLNIPLKRKIYTVTANIIASKLFNIGLKDCTYGYRMTRLSLVKNIDFNQNDFSIIMEELYHLKKKRAIFKDFPVTQTSRIDTKASFQYTLQQLWNYLKYAIKAATI